MFEEENLRGIGFHICAAVVSKGRERGYNRKSARADKTAKMPAQGLRQTCNVQLVNWLHSPLSSQNLLPEDTSRSRAWDMSFPCPVL